jgi:hypothetical protein
MSTSPITIDRALMDRRLLGAGLGDDPSSWSMWMSVFKSAFGLGLTDEQRALFASVAGQRKPPTQRVRELWCLVGRRGGKSRIAGLLAVYFACFVKHKLAPGETGVVLVLAATTEQAGVVFDYAKAALAESPALRHEIASVTRTEIRLKNGIVIGVHPNSFRTSRGRTLCAAIFDEIAFWRDETTATPDHEVYSAILPSLATTGGMLIGISSPYRKLGLLHTKHRDHFGQDSERILVVQGPTSTFNPSLSAAEIASQREADPGAARSEWDAEFRDDLQSYLPDEVIDRAIDHSRPLELPPVSGVFYRAFVDASGGTGRDAYTIAIAHVEADHYVIDLVRGTTGAFDPQAVTEDYAKLCKDYKIGSVVGDRYAAAWTSGAWERTAVHYVTSDIPKSQIYLEAIPTFTRGQASLPNHPKLIRELRLLERQTHRGGRESVDHPKNGGHDDFANVTAGVLRILSDHLGRGSTGLDYSGFLDGPADRINFGYAKAQAARARMQETIDRISQPPQPPHDLLDLIRRGTPKERFTNADPK